MKQQIQFCRSQDGTRIAYATSGSGPPLLYVANWLTHLKLDWNSPLWSHWFQELSRGHTLIRFDARGNGLSDRVVKNLSLDDWVQDLAAVADDIGLERFPILGFCQGGATALAYAVHHPERVMRLVLHVQGSKMVNFEEGRRLASIIPGARFVPLEGQNHILLQEDAAWPRFLSEVRDFLGAETLPKTTSNPQQAISRLTPREKEVLSLVACGLSNDQIAQRLTIASKTVRNHVTRIYGKLDVDSRARAVVLAREANVANGDRA